MKLFLRIIKNDSRRNWTLLTSWIVTLILSAVLHACTQAWLFEMTDLLVWLTPAVLIFSWMNEECFVGIGEFWMTRPVVPLLLLSSKLTGLLLWLSIPYLAYSLILTQIHHASLGLALSILGETFALQQLPLWLLLIMIAVLTRTFTQALILSVSCFIGVAVLANITTHIWGRLSWFPHYKFIQLSFPPVTVAAMFAALLATFTQARFRHRGLTALVILLGSAAAICAPKLQSLTRAVISPHSLVSSDRALSLSLDNKVRLISGSNDKRETAIALSTLQIQGLPAGEIATVVKCSYTFDCASSVTQWKHDLSPRPVLGSDLEAYNTQNPITIPFDRYDKKPSDLNGVQKGRLTAKLLLAIHSVKRFEAPWKTGSYIQANSLQVKMNSLMDNQRIGGAEQACKILVTGYDRWKSSWTVFLRRNDTGEQSSSYGDGGNDTLFTTLRTTECTTPLRVYRRTSNKTDKLPFETVAPSWLNGASLIVIQSQLVHTQSATVMVEDFEMPVATSK